MSKHPTRLSYSALTCAARAACAIALTLAATVPAASAEINNPKAAAADKGEAKAGLKGSSVRSAAAAQTAPASQAAPNGTRSLAAAQASVSTAERSAFSATRSALAGTQSAAGAASPSASRSIAAAQAANLNGNALSSGSTRASVAHSQSASSDAKPSGTRMASLETVQTAGADQRANLRASRSKPAAQSAKTSKRIFGKKGVARAQAASPKHAAQAPLESREALKTARSH